METKDKFGMTDIAQILAGSFIIIASVYSGQNKTVSTFGGILLFAILLVIGIFIFSVTSKNKKGVLLRLLIAIPMAFIVASIAEYVITESINIGRIFLYAGLVLPVSAGIDALRK